MTRTRPPARVERAAPAPGTVPGRSAADRRRLFVALVALVGVAAVLLAGWWGLRADRSAEAEHATDSAPAGWVEVPGGWMTVREVSDRSLDHRGMPGMQTMPDPDPVPDGYVRLTVDVALAARDDTLRWRPEDFSVRGPGIGVVRPHRAQLGDGVVPADSQVAGGLTFEVPEDATHLELRFRGSDPVAFSPPAVRSHGHHGT